MTSRARLCFAVCAAAAVATGIALAAARYWMCDDAFITFRYADNLVRGHGLVFNAGERVEGYTNLLWTLWVALGLRIGASAEGWAGFWGIACFAATLALLARRGWTIARAAGVAWPLPAAALLASIHHEWTVFATSGLETAAFMFLAVLGYLLVAPAESAAASRAGSEPAPRASPEPSAPAVAEAASRTSPEPSSPAVAEAASRTSPEPSSPVGAEAASRTDPEPSSPVGAEAASRTDPEPSSRVGAEAASRTSAETAPASSGSLGEDGPAARSRATPEPGWQRWAPTWGRGGLLRRHPARLVAAGAVFALASLTRPDGVLLAAVCGVWLLAGRDVRGALGFAAGFAVLWLPATIWRIAYYGDLFPNTYYAKSASIAWWSQGWFYARIYFARYWVLLLALPCAAFARPRRAVALELALAAVYALYVMRVGGDFMFGRLLLPVTPFLLIVIERGLVALLGRRPVLRAAAIAALGGVLLAMPAAVDGHQRPRGIADERDAYTVELAGWAERADSNGATLAALFDGLPVSVCFFGAQARLVYRSRVATAIECETGLTDAAIAHQPLVVRGRIGHEKHAQLPYLLARHVDFVLTRDYANEVLHLDAQLPDVPIELGRVRGRVISWDPAIMAALASRGVRVPDVPGQIDRIIAAMAGASDEAVRRDWQRFRRLYFDRVPDPRREAPFRARLGTP